LVSEYFQGKLKTISCGEGSERVTFLYDSDLITMSSTDSDRTCSPSSSKGKRPTQQLYQPPAAASSSNMRSISPSTPGPLDNEEEEDWESLYDDSGDCVKPDLIKEFKKAVSLTDDKGPTKVKNQIKFEACSSDLRDFCSTTDSNSCSLTDDDYGHVLEVYDFDSDLKSSDLFARIASVGTSDFNIVWVDDTHALAVFGSEQGASSAVRFSIPDLKVRVLSQANNESRLKARRCTERLLPFKKRPQTSVDAARRLVGRHLGLKVQVSREQLLAEKKVLQEAKDKRRQTKKQTNDVWEGNVD